MGWDFQGGKKIKSGILFVSVGERVHAVDSARWDGERGEGTLFDAAFCKEVEEPVGTLEVSCWYKAYSGFCAGLRGVLWEVFLFCAGVCAEFNFVVFIKVNGGPCHERPQRDCAGHAAIYWERVEPKNALSTMRKIILLFIYLRVTSFMYCGLVPLPF